MAKNTEKNDQDVINISCIRKTAKEIRRQSFEEDKRVYEIVEDMWREYKKKKKIK